MHVPLPKAIELFKQVAIFKFIRVSGLRLKFGIRPRPWSMTVGNFAKLVCPKKVAECNRFPLGIGSRPQRRSLVCPLSPPSFAISFFLPTFWLLCGCLLTLSSLSSPLWRGLLFFAIIGFHLRFYIALASISFFHSFSFWRGTAYRYGNSVCRSTG